MLDMKNALYLLTMKSYLIDEVDTIYLDDNCKMIIKAHEFRDWSEYGLLNTIIFKVNIICNQDNYKVYFEKHSYKNINQILSSDDDYKWNFIFRRKAGLCKTYNINMVKIPGNKMSKSMKIMILKRLSNEVDIIVEEAKQFLNNNDSKKILKLKKRCINK